MSHNFRSSSRFLKDLLQSGNRKSHCCFRRDGRLFFAGGSGDAGPGSCAGHGADGCTFATARQGPDHGSCRSSAANLGGVALGMALAFAVIGAAGDVLAIDGGQPQGELAGSMQASAGFGVGDLARHFAAGASHRLAVNHDVPGQGAMPGFACMRRARTQR